MKKRIIILMTVLLLAISVCVGCGAESTTTEPTETPTATTTEESATEQTEEATATPKETAEPTPEVKEEPIEETTAETEPETTEPTETVEPEPTKEPTPETEPQAIYTYTDMSATMYAQQTVNIRDLPDTNGNKIGSLSTNDEIKISGQCIETGWYMFEHNGSVAFVSDKYVSESKVEVQAPAENNGSSGGGSTASNYPNPYDYPEGVWVDMGDWFFIVNSYEWGRNGGNFTDITATLEARFPGETILYGGGFPLNDGSGRYCWFCVRKGTYLIPFTEAYMAK